MTASATSAARVVRTQVVTAARAHRSSSLTRVGIAAGQHAGDHRLDAREQVRDADQVADDVVAVGPDPRHELVQEQQLLADDDDQQWLVGGGEKGAGGGALPPIPRFPPALQVSRAASAKRRNLLGQDWRALSPRPPLCVGVLRQRRRRGVSARPAFAARS